METQKAEKKYTGYGYHGGGRKPTGVKRVMFQVSCTPGQRDRVKELAKQSGMNVSEFILSKALS